VTAWQEATSDSDQDGVPGTRAEQLEDAVVVGSVSRLMGGTPEPVRLGRFTLARRTGRGGSGTVYEAQDSELGCQVALKVLHGGHSRREAEAEFRALGGLCHPGIVRYHGLHHIDELRCLSMQLLSGKTLVDWVTSSTDSTRRVGEVVRQVAAALSYLHSQGVTHGDIKASNALVEEGGRVRLIDFGLASTGAPGESNRRRGGTAGNTPGDGREQRPSDDWYALGRLVTRLLASARATARGDATQESAAARLEALALALTDSLHSDASARAAINTALDLQTDSGARPQFIGRATEQKKLAEWLVPSSRTAVSLLVGESGIGKTTLARAVLEELVSSDLTRVFSARSYSQPSTQLNTLDELADSICCFIELQPANEQSFYEPQHRDELAAVIPVFDRLPKSTPRAHTPCDQQEIAYRAGLAFRDVLARISTKAPVVVWIDDAQWLEEGAWRILSALLQNDALPRVRMLLSARTEKLPTSGLEKRLADLGGPPSVLELSGLEPEAAKTLVRLSGHDLQASDQLDHLVQSSTGHPLFLQEVLTWAATRTDSPPSLHAMVRERAAQLGPQSRELLELLAISQGPVPQQVLKAALGEHAVEASLLIRERLVRRASGPGHPLDVYHDHIRAALVSELESDHCESLHLALARALETHGETSVESGTIAFHLRRGGRPQESRDWLRKAAASAEARLNFPEAAALHRIALELSNDSSSGHESLMALAEAERASGRSEVAADCFLEAASESTVEPQRIYLRRMGVRELLRAGRTEAARPHMRLLLRHLGVPFPTSRVLLVIRTLWLMSMLRIFGFGRTSARSAEGRKYSETVRADVCWSISHGVSQTDMLLAAYFSALTNWLARRAADPPRIAHAMARAANVRSLMAPYSLHVRKALDTARVEALRLDDHYAQALVLLADAHASLNRAEWKQALQFGLAAEKSLREESVGVPHDLLAAHTAVSNAMDFLGLVSQYKERVTRLRAEASRRGNHILALTMGADEHRCHLFDNDPEQARSTLDTVLHEWPGDGFVLPHAIVHLGHVWTDLYQGKLDTALEKALRASKLVRSQMGHKLTLLRVQMDGTVGRAAAAVFLARGCSTARRHARAAARRLRREPGLLGPGYAALITGLVSFPDHPAVALSSLEKAAATFDALSMNHWAMSTRWARASLQDATSEGPPTPTMAGVVCPRRMAMVYAPIGRS